MREKRFCPYCGKELGKIDEQGRERSYCSVCVEIIYENPLPAVAALVENGDNELLLVQRAVEPAVGRWGLPGGFIEVDETVEDAVLRELKEETGIEGRIKKLINISSQLSHFWGRLVIIIGYRIEISGGILKPGDDAQDAMFFPLSQLPPVVFSSHRELIKAYREEKKSESCI
ncbi:MAG: NUDIX hydrolase [Thermodesulfobacteriota bacterium]|nr:NUDIX hydrolase [Thermodesulfobacteriota bacterium]